MRLLALVLMVASCGRDGRLPPAPVPAPATEFPAWAAVRGPPQRIAGHLYIGQAPAAGRVHLRLDVPDRTAWAGVDLDVGVSGAFDFGEQPPARYLVLGTTETMTSRPIPVDTRAGAVTDQDVFLHACVRHEGVLRDGNAPVAGAVFDLAGVIVAATREDGRYSYCSAADWGDANAVRIRTPDHAVDFAHTTIQPLREQTELRGVVRNAEGQPMAGVGVQPLLRRQRLMTHVPTTLEIAVASTTDQRGSFTIRGAPRWEERGSLEAVYGFRVIAEGRYVTDESFEPTRGRREVVVTYRPEDVEPVWDDRFPGAVTVSGRVTHGGSPLADALIVVEIDGNSGGGPSAFRDTRTSRDGRFVIALPRHDGTVALSVAHARGFFTSRRVVPDTTGELTIDVRARSTISGIAVYADGTPVKKRTLWIHAQDASIQTYATTSVSGRFQVPALEIGHVYDVRIGRTVVDTIELNAAPITGHRIVVRPWIIEGVVLDERGAPAAGVDVFASGVYEGRLWKPPGTSAKGIAGWTGFSMYQVAVTDTQGRYRYEPVLDDERAILATTMDGRSAIVQTLHPGESPPPMTLQLPGLLAITCDDADWEAMGGVHVWQGLVEARVECGVEMGSLPPGTWTVAAKADGMVYALATATVSSGERAEAKLQRRPIVRLEGLAIEYPSGRPLVGVECEFETPVGPNHSSGDDEGITGSDGRFSLRVPAGVSTVSCEERSGAHVRGETSLVLDADGTTTVRMVVTKPNAVDVGVTYDVEERGARLTVVRDHAARAGLERGDLVLAANGVSLADLGFRAMRELAFRVDRGEIATLTVERGGRALAIAVSP